MSAVNSEAYTRLASGTARLLGELFFVDRRFRIFLVVILANGMAMGPFLPFLAIYARDELGMSQSFTANYRTITSLLMGLSVLLGAVASDSLGPKSSMLLGLLGTAVAGGVFILHSPGLLLALAALHGSCQGFLAIGGETFLIRAAPLKRIGAAAATYYLGSTVGSATGAALGGAIVEATSFRTLGLVMLACGLAITLAALLFLPPVRPAAIRRPSLGSLIAGYFQILRRGYVRPFVFVELFRNMFWSSASLAMPLIVATLTGSKVTVGYFSAIILLCGTLGALVTGPISDRTGRRIVFLILLAAMALSAGLLGLGVGTLILFFGAGMLAAGAAWALAAQVPALVKELALPGEAGRLLGLSMFPSAIGILIGAQLHGQLTESRPGLEFYLLGASLIAALVLAVLMFRARPAAVPAAKPAGQTLT